MSILAITITLLAIGMILGGILLLKKSAKKFLLTEEQLEKIKARNEQLEKEQQQDE
ncbi:DUF2897 family protein [Colwelliaceae bacterium 6471]